MGDDGAGVLLEMVPSATPPHARNAPSSRPKGDGDKREALPYAQLLSQVQVGVTMEPRWRHAFDGDPLSRSLATLSCLRRSRSQGHFTQSL
jgi:hypothetical protein